MGAAHISVDSPADDESDLGDSEADIFVGRSQPMPHGRVFGGQVLAQSIIAAGRTVEDVDGEPRHMHCLHGYFLRPGDYSHPIRFAVERLRDGRSFSARRMHAIQYGKPILSMITSFQTPADGLDHQDPMPASRTPSSCPTADELRGLRQRASRASGRRGGRSTCGTSRARSTSRRPAERAAQQSVWLKAAGRLPDDPLLHAAVLAYGSDYSLLEPVLRRTAWPGPTRGCGPPASTTRCGSTARPAPTSGPHAQASPSASGGRGLAIGRMFAADGTLVASVAQEGMLRVKDS